MKRKAELQRGRRATVHTEACERCFYCDVYLASTHTHDHFPKVFVDGGTGVVPACRNCHDLKDQMNLEDWPLALILAGFEEMGPKGRLLMAKCVAVVSQTRATYQRLNASAVGAKLDRELAVELSSLKPSQPDPSASRDPLLFLLVSSCARLERDLTAQRVKEGMRQAVVRGSKIGRPSVTRRPAFARKWRTIRLQLEAGTLSRRKAAETLHIGQATLKRLLEADGASNALAG